MPVLLYFIPPFLAYRMGARGGWFVSIILFSWPAYVVWLIARRPALFAERERQREAAELERTLMVVRAMNPALAEEIAEQKAYERVAPLMATRPPKAARPKHQTAVMIFALLAVLTALAMAPRLERQEAAARLDHQSTDDHAPPAATAEAHDPAPSGDRACNSSDKQRLAAQMMIKSAGYDCDVVDSVCPYVFSEGFSASCNRYRYSFKVENHGGRWSVTAD
jgi:hypothetical protein